MGKRKMVMTNVKVPYPRKNYELTATEEYFIFKLWVVLTLTWASK